ncbi:MAG: branched-chain amino acid ABC transporter permease, partial [Pseudomonadota bacterium]|nr:branched-chain amino acid ABC transporter permease [Pseudomonadota bacterium]
MGGWRVPVAAALAIALLPLFVSPYVQDVVVRIAVYAIFALSLELIVGGVGLVSLGHAAFFGIGAYATVLVSGEAGARLALVLIVSVASAAAYALFVGALSLRTRGVYFIMVTLAFAQMAYFVFHDTKVGGGSDGIFLSVKPVLRIAGATWLDLGARLSFYYAVLAALVATYAVLALLLASRFGHALAGIRVNEQRMRAAGFSSYFYKLAAFVIAGALAGLAGALLAIKDGAVNPELLAWQESGAVLLMLILGGVGSLRGAVIGAIAF